MGVALLSAADAEWPLLAAAADPGAALDAAGSGDGGLEAAVAAPAALRRRLGAVAGPVAAMEPDLVLVRSLESFLQVLLCVDHAVVCCAVRRGIAARVYSLPLPERHTAADCESCLTETEFLICLMQVFGEVLTLGGFPPWAARAAEVYRAGPLRGVTAAGLHAALLRYRRTRQRFGR